LRAFCHLVARDGLGASAILQTQLRHAINLADYIAARTPSAQPRLKDDTRVLGVLELQIEHGLRKSLNTARQAVHPDTWREDPIEAFARFIEARADAETVERQVLENFARVTRSLRQAAYAQPTEFPPPSLFFGLEQAKIAERVDSLARVYHRELLVLANSLGVTPRLATTSALAVSYEYIGSSNHSHTECRLHDALELHTQISVPLWLLYTPRYLPTLCHELAHPIAAELLGDHGCLGFALEKFRPVATRLIEQHFGRGGLRSVPNIVPAIARELLTDVLSVRAAGPIYAVAWHANTLGRGAISPQQGLSLPTCVRLRLLTRICGAGLTSVLADVLDADTRLYRGILERRRYVEKAAFQEALHDACAPLIDDMITAFSSGRQPPPSAWATDINDAFGAIRRIPRFTDAVVPSAEELEILWSGSSLRSVPGVLWETHLRAAGATMEAPMVPEGRLFHGLHTNHRVRWVEGDYSEWLWVKRTMTAPRAAFQAWWLEQTHASDPLVADVIGAYNFLSVRRRFDARSFDNYPPAAGDHHFHAARQILVEVRRADAPFEDVLGDAFRVAPLLVIEAHVPPDADDDAFLDLATAARPDLRTVAVFKTLSTGDYVFLVHVDEVSAVPGMLADLQRNAPAVRTATSVILPATGVMPAAQSAPAHGSGTSVRAFLRFQREPSPGWATDLGIAVERVLGADDVEWAVPVESVGDLEKVLTIADMIASLCALATFHARTGFVVP